METSTVIIFLIILGLMILNIYLLHKNRQEFECPDCNCPECEKVQKCLVPSNKSIIAHLIKFYIDPLIKSDEQKDFMNKNMIFSNPKEVLFEEDYNKIYTNLKDELLENRFRFNHNNLRYLYPPNKDKEKEFVDLYKITDFPTPLVTFKGTNILLGYVDVAQEWKYFINNNIYLKNNNQEN